ncbi:hypothetical protein BGW38_004795 [Lunasporangiospora selenospora]|uniref:Uncharacterized protein n=1 Tax=Lunasporangiospora selenospora TaxID=979761 RepID=A0A9P6KBS9_9FUNG|nr:hypothetical protein BGW38_004795 [Lunasporangiospora selenospora]
MIVSLYNSVRSSRLSTKIALLTVIMACLVTDLADDGVSLFIKAAQQEMNHSSYVNSIQSIGGAGEPFVLVTTMNQGDVPRDFVMSNLNNTNINPGAIKGKVYRPQTSDYKSECAMINIDNVFLTGRISAIDPCSSLQLDIRGNFNITGDRNVVRSKDSARLIAPIIFNGSGELRAVATMLTNDTEECDIDQWDAPFDTSSYTNQLFGAQTIFVPLRYQANGVLFDNMAELFTNGTFASPTFAIEARVDGTNVEALACHTTNLDVADFYPPNHCFYTNIATILIDPKNNQPSFKSFLMKEGRMVVNFPLINVFHRSRWGGAERSLNLTALKATTLGLRDTFASLGQNILVSSSIEIVYDTYDIVDGFEVPTWLAYLVMMIMVVCAIIWGLTLYLLDERLTSSLYKLISLELVPHTAPIPMRSKLNPIEIEGHPVVSIEEKHQLQDRNPDSARSSLDILAR